LENIAIEMGHKLMRMSYSSIIRESEDFGAALTDAEGRQLCECSKYDSRSPMRLFFFTMPPT
jgi:N-methylhydantoinase B